MPGLKGDPVEADAGSGCCSGMSGAQRVAGDPFGGHASSTGSGPQHPGDGFAGDRFIGGEPVAEAGEQRTGRISTDGRPSRQGRDGGGDRVLPVGERRPLGRGHRGRSWSAVRAGGGRRVWYRRRRARGCQLGAAQGRGDAEQNDRRVTGALGAGAVDAGDDQADVGCVQRACESGCGAQGAAQAASYLSDRLGEDRIVQSVTPAKPHTIDAGSNTTRRDVTEQPARRDICVEQLFTTRAYASSSTRRSDAWSSTRRRSRGVIVRGRGWRCTRGFGQVGCSAR